jgi:hypothetical protein
VGGGSARTGETTVMNMTMVSNMMMNFFMLDSPSEIVINLAYPTLLIGCNPGYE